MGQNLWWIQVLGSCSASRLGANCHLSAGAGLGGILEPVGSKPTIIEDDCFIGALLRNC